KVALPAIALLAATNAQTASPEVVMMVDANGGHRIESVQQQINDAMAQSAIEPRYMSDVAHCIRTHMSEEFEKPTVELALAATLKTFEVSNEILEWSHENEREFEE